MYLCLPRPTWLVVRRLALLSCHKQWTFVVSCEQDVLFEQESFAPGELWLPS